MYYSLHFETFRRLKSLILFHQSLSELQRKTLSVAFHLWGTGSAQFLKKTFSLLDIDRISDGIRWSQACRMQWHTYLLSRSLKSHSVVCHLYPLAAVCSPALGSGHIVHAVFHAQGLERLIFLIRKEKHGSQTATLCSEHHQQIPLTDWSKWRLANMAQRHFTSSLPLRLSGVF